MQVETIIHGRWIIPVEPDGVVHEHHAIAVDAGRIVDILPSQDAAERYQARNQVRLPEHALIPGLVNTHTHAAMTLFRGLADDLPLMEWLNGHIWPAEQRWVNPAFVRAGTRHAIAEMIRGGTTCFSDMYFFPDHVAQVTVEAGMRAVVGLILIDFPTAWAHDADDYLRKGEEVHDEYRGHPLIRTAFAPHAPYTVSDAALERVAVHAEELDIPIHMHVHETAEEVSQAQASGGSRPLARLKALGLLSPRLIAVHMTQLADAEIALVAEHGVQVAHCPESNLKLASGFCPVHRLQGSGVNVALGTDGAASNNDLDMFGEMHTAALLAKAVAGDSCAVPAALALQMATLNGARALGIDDVCGSLAPGKAADVVAVRLGGLEAQPVYDPVSQLVYSGGRERVSDVWIAGRRVLEGRQLRTLDTTAIIGESRQWGQRIAESDERGNRV